MLAYPGLSVFLCVLCAACIIPLVGAAHYTAYVDSMMPYEYISRFAFQTESVEVTKHIAETTKTVHNGQIQANANVDGGHIEYDILFPRYFRPKMLLFTSYDNWVMERKQRLSCNELVHLADKVIHLADNAQYTTYDANDKLVYSNQAENSQSSAVWNAKGTLFFPQVAADDYESYRWGVIYVANCDSNSTTPASWCSNTNNCQGPTVLDFEMQLLNGKGPVRHLSGRFCFFVHIGVYEYVCALRVPACLNSYNFLLHCHLHPFFSVLTSTFMYTHTHTHTHIHTHTHTYAQWTKPVCLAV